MKFKLFCLKTFKIFKFCFLFCQFICVLLKIYLCLLLSWRTCSGFNNKSMRRWWWLMLNNILWRRWLLLLNNSLRWWWRFLYKCLLCRLGLLAAWRRIYYDIWLYFIWRYKLRKFVWAVITWVVPSFWLGKIRRLRIRWTWFVIIVKITERMSFVWSWVNWDIAVQIATNKLFLKYRCPKLSIVMNKMLFF